MAYVIYKTQIIAMSWAFSRRTKNNVIVYVSYTFASPLKTHPSVFLCLSSLQRVLMIDY